eukprot:CFRG4853T1
MKGISAYRRESKTVFVLSFNRHTRLAHELQGIHLVARMLDTETNRSDIHGHSFFDSDDDNDFPDELLGGELGVNKHDKPDASTADKRPNGETNFDFIDEFDFVADPDLDELDGPLGEDDGGKDKADAPLDGKKKRPAVKRLKMNEDLILSENGLPLLYKCVKGIKFRGKGYEADDLRSIILAYEMWAHKLMPGLHFDDFSSQIEKKGSTAVRQVISRMKEESQTCPNDDIDAYETMGDNEADAIDAAMAEEEEARRRNGTSHAFDDLDDIFSAEVARSTAVPLNKTSAPPISPTLIRRMTENRAKAVAARERKRQRERDENQQKLQEHVSEIRYEQGKSTVDTTATYDVAPTSILDDL